VNERKIRSQPPDTTSTLAAIGPVARSSVVDAVADRLRGEILSGRLEPGSRLPSERELSLALGVNRLTLRASLARLEALGLIAIRHGAGTVVASWRERAGLDTLMTLIGSLKPGDPALHELVTSTLEVRRILASEAIALAAKRRTEEDIRTIAECAEAMKAKVDDPLAYARADVVFMRVVVRTARNVGLELLLNTFARFPDEQPALVVSLYDRCAEAVALYPLLVELIRNGDADIARETVRRALERMDEAWAERHAPPRARSDAKAPRRKR
jgi:GntR family transcriptional regulator, transcriptional repressor for pyruvate dehydrogenase complex